MNISKISMVTSIASAIVSIILAGITLRDVYREHIRNRTRKMFIKRHKKYARRCLSTIGKICFHKKQNNTDMTAQSVIEIIINLIHENNKFDPMMLSCLLLFSNYGLIPKGNIQNIEDNFLFPSYKRFLHIKKDVKKDLKSSYLDKYFNDLFDEMYPIALLKSEINGLANNVLNTKEYQQVSQK